MGTAKVLIIDHYDSYTNNILQLLQGTRTGHDGVPYPEWNVVIVRFDQFSWYVPSSPTLTTLKCSLEISQGVQQANSCSRDQSLPKYSHHWMQSSCHQGQAPRKEKPTLGSTPDSFRRYPSRYSVSVSGIRDWYLFRCKGCTYSKHQTWANMPDTSQRTRCSQGSTTGI